MEVIPSIHQLQIPMPRSLLGHLNSYLIVGDKGCLLIDTGVNDEQAFGALQEQLHSAGFGFQDIILTLITHVHPDHYGLMGRLLGVSTTRLTFHLWEKALIESRYVHITELEAKTEQFLRRHGVPRKTAVSMKSGTMLGPVTVAWPDEVLYGGEAFAFGEFKLEVLWTPGHSPGHVCLYEQSKKLLFSGDHILPNITPNISYHLLSGCNPLGDYIDSLNQIRKLPVNMVLPAHEGTFEDMEKRIGEILAHHDERKDNILAIIGKTRKNAYQITTKMQWNVPGYSFNGLDMLSKRIAMTETIAHLELLRTEERVEKLLINGVTHYRRAAA